MKLYHINSTLNPFEEARKIQRQLDQVFSEISNELTQEFSGENYTLNGSVAIEVEETATEFYLRALLPGLDRDQLDLSITRNRVTIAGQYQHSQARTKHESKRSSLNEKYRFYSEFPTGKFCRTLSLPVPVLNTEAIAEYRDGVLTLTIPKAPEAIDQVVKLSLNTSNVQVKAQTNVQANAQSNVDTKIQTEEFTAEVNPKMVTETSASIGSEMYTTTAPEVDRYQQ